MAHCAGFFLSIASAAALSIATASAAPTPLRQLPGYVAPAYWNNFQAAKNAGWSDPNQIRISVWLEAVTMQSQIDEDKAAGINTYLNITGNSDLGLIRKNGLSVIPGGKFANVGKETVGWFLNDETDMKFGPGYAAWTGIDQWGNCLNAKNVITISAQCGYTVLKKMKAAFPNDGRMHVANFGKGVAFWHRNAEAARFVNGYTDAVSIDVYWYSDKDACTAWQGGKFLGKMGADGLPRALTASECHRASNYGRLVDRVKYLDSFDGKYQPVYAFVEVGSPFEQNSKPITVPQIEGAVMSSLIHGANGVLYFNHSFGGPCKSQHVIRDCISDPEFAAFNHFVQELAPILNAPMYKWVFNPELDTRLSFDPQGIPYIFAQQNARNSGIYDFAMPPSLNAMTKADVLRENRSLQIANGKFSDSFAYEYSWHVYKLGSGGANKTQQIAANVAPLSPAPAQRSLREAQFLRGQTLASQGGRQSVFGR